MKSLLCIVAMFLCLTACNKITEEELQQMNSTELSENGVTPVPPYQWYGMTVPVMSGSPFNNPDHSNKIIQVNADVYCLMGGSLMYTYKLNNNTKRWESQSIPFFSSFGTGQQYFFSYQSKVYGGMYRGYEGTSNNFFSRDMVTNTLTNLAPFPGIPVSEPTCFIIGDKGYLLSGYAGNSANLQNQLWEYNITTNQWTNKGSSPLGARGDATAMVVDDKVYMGLGYSYINLNGQQIKQYKNDWILYNPGSPYFGNMAAFPGTKRSHARGFVLNDIPFIGFGNNDSSFFTDFWKYNPANNTWTQQASWPGNGNAGDNNIGTFSIGNTGYAVKGALAEFWRFSTSSIVVQ